MLANVKLQWKPLLTLEKSFAMCVLLRLLLVLFLLRSLAADNLTAFAVIVVFVKRISWDVVSRSRFPLAGNFVSANSIAGICKQKTERVLIGRLFYRHCG